VKDFGYELASIRQMTTTKIFLRNSDREIGYASDVIGDGRLLVQLPTATAIIHNAHWGAVRVRVRPPFSKVHDMAEAQLRQLVGPNRDATATISAAAQGLLTAIKQHASPDQPLNMSRAAILSGISSKRRLIELVSELEHAGLIRTKQLVERGRPRVIEFISTST